MAHHQLRRRTRTLSAHDVEHVWQDPHSHVLVVVRHDHVHVPARGLPPAVRAPADTRGRLPRRGGGARRSFHNGENLLNLSRRRVVRGGRSEWIQSRSLNEDGGERKTRIEEGCKQAWCRRSIR